MDVDYVCVSVSVHKVTGSAADICQGQGQTNTDNIGNEKH